MEHAAVHAKLVEKFGEAILGLDDSGIEPHCDVAPERIAEVATFLRDEPALGFDALMCLSGIDWDGYDDSGKGKSVAILGYREDGTPETSDRVADGDFGVVYNLYSHEHQHRFTLRVRVARDVAAVPTVSTVWPTAAWHEREAWDLVGIQFAGHADLRRILLDDAWEGHPLRKDYQMPGGWEGIELKGRPLSDNPHPRPAPTASGGDGDTADEG
jgi:NADH-quinone oxidoreductase subunit C